VFDLTVSLRDRHWRCGQPRIATSLRMRVVVSSGLGAGVLRDQHQAAADFNDIYFLPVLWNLTFNWRLLNLSVDQRLKHYYSGQIERWISSGE